MAGEWHRLRSAHFDDAPPWRDATFPTPSLEILHDENKQIVRHSWNSS